MEIKTSTTEVKTLRVFIDIEGDPTDIKDFAEMLSAVARQHVDSTGSACMWSGYCESILADLAKAGVHPDE